MTLVQAMQTALPSVQAGDSLTAAAERMRDGGCVALPVVDDQGDVIGTLSVQDLAYRLGNAAAPTEDKVGALIRPDPVCCPPETPLEEVAELISRQRQPAVLVKAPQGPILGMVDIFQILDALTPPQAAAGPVPDYVQRVRGEA
ncbi:putative signal-transduction protein containing cAMP-binding and CBS domains [Thioflavicoccus mobilis 8321]|uniref:Putative signal-transduction protein containing cAMP-binding and CBS domains n=1 Tax=Thioflavicoccus mobilis 8321 TaxID=765912 RepID=L0GY11_9GAMM|nr:CBS domain-containing protein [Thioflavicoccus mobilis]AGA90194.1 putative signal-transduction protein containing cAMP-binding and CBS domains [Thioflavicoccus mobilis 8321]